MDDDREVATTNGNQLPSTLPDLKKYGIDMGEEDIVMPRLVLLQPTSDVTGEGKFYYTLSKELFDTVECVVFSNQRGRVMFDPDLKARQSICGSNDRVAPSTRFEEPKSETCIECKYHKRGYFEEIQSGKDKLKLECQETNTIKAMFIDNHFPFLMVARKTSLQPFNNWLTEMTFEIAKNKRPLHCFPIRITSTIPKKATTKYYIPVIERMPMMEKAEFAAMMQKYADYNPDDTYAAEEASNKEPPVDDEGTPF